MIVIIRLQLVSNDLVNRLNIVLVSERIQHLFSLKEEKTKIIFKLLSVFCINFPYSL